MYDGSTHRETLQPGPIVRLRRDPDCDRFDLVLSGVKVRVGLLTQPEQDATDADLDSSLELLGLTIGALAAARVVVSDSGTGRLALFAIDEALIESVDTLLPACWYLVDLQPTSGDIDDHEEPTEQDCEVPARLVVVDPNIDGDDDAEEVYDLGDLLGGETQHSEISVSARELTPVTMPFPGLDPMAAGFEPEQVIEQLRKQVDWEKHRREVAEAEVDRLQEILRARSIEA